MNSRDLTGDNLRVKKILRDRLMEDGRPEGAPDYAWNGDWSGPAVGQYVIMKDGEEMEPGDLIDGLNELEDLRDAFRYMVREDQKKRDTAAEEVSELGLPPGPWTVGLPGGPSGDQWSVVGSNGRIVALFIPEEATARAIAKIPTMIRIMKTLERLLDALEEERNDRSD